ncbi:FkbM family methyltransferase [Desulfovibrio caledoniensis]
MSIIKTMWQSEVERKLDRILNDVDFIKNRTSAYLGRNESLTYLKDETPIFVNTDDIGCPLNFINGGMYEEEEWGVFLSYRTPDGTALDVGANLGVYSLRLAPYLRQGRIHAFEPNGRIRQLFSRSVFLNGYTHIIDINGCAISDRDGEASLSLPEDHAGGGSLEGGEGNGGVVQVRTLDSVLPQGTSVTMIKLDVEGHELKALTGMLPVLKRSPDAVLLFEKLAADSDIADDLFELLGSLGYQVYAIAGTTIRQTDHGEFTSTGGYFLAGRPERIEDGGLERNFVDIFPCDFNILNGGTENGAYRSQTGDCREGDILFHGPYWYLPRGAYRLTIDGEINGPFDLDISERFGYKVESLRLVPGRNEYDFIAYRDLTKFEFVLRTGNKGGDISLKKMRLRRMG